MEVKTLSEGTPYEFAIVGRLDTNSSPALEEFAGTLYDKSANDIAVDMSECDFVSSAGLRIIIAMQGRAASTQGNIEFRNVSA